MIPHPPQIRSFEITHATRLRFTVVGAGPIDGPIAVSDLLDMILFASSATQLYDVFGQVKVKSVEIWSVNVGAVQSSTVSVVFNGADVASGDRVIHTDTAMGIEPAYVCARPSRKSLISNYQSSTPDVAFSINAPVGSIIDVDCVFRAPFDFAVAARNLGTGLTTGAIYLRGLDGEPFSTSQARPVLSDYGA